MPFITRIRILDSVTNTYAKLEMKDYVKYLGSMIDSNLSWRYHIESICHNICKSIGIIAKIRHYVPRCVLLSVYNSLIIPYLTYGTCAWGNCALTFQRKIVTLQKRALRLIYFCKPKEHTVPFFLKSNCLPLPSLFSEIVAIYCMILTDRQHLLAYSITMLKQVRFITTEQDLSLATHFTLSSLDLIKCMPFSPESVPKFQTLFLIPLNYLNVHPFVRG